MAKPTYQTAFSAGGLSLLSELAENNSTEWFHAHKDAYQTRVQAPMLGIVEAVNVSLAGFAPAYTVAKKNPISRPNRDTRFSKDKSPYRTDVAAVFPCRGLEKQQAAGYFIRVHATGAELIAGAFMPGPDELRKIRQSIDKRGEQFARVTSAKPITTAFGALQGEQLVRVPKPFASDHHWGDLLRRTQFYYRRELSKSVVVSSRFVPEIVSSFRAALPFVEMIDGILGN